MSDEHSATAVEEAREAMEEEDARSDCNASTTAGRSMNHVYACDIFSCVNSLVIKSLHWKSHSVTQSNLHWTPLY